MNILMMTNTFTPHVGGVARSVEAFTAEYRRRGHRVLVVAPEFENMPEDEVDVVRLPAIQRFNGSDFSVVLPVPKFLTSAIEAFRPDVVHSHHPFLVGATALRVAHVHRLPLVFTHHTMYEHYTHYVPGDSAVLKRFVIDLSTNYANLCHQVFAPCESIAEVLRRRGVTAPLAVLPTGVELKWFRRGHGAGFRAAMGIPDDALVVGHLGRLAPEKNLEFLAESAAAFLKSEDRAHFLVAGTGPSEPAIREIFDREAVGDRLHLSGVLQHPLLASAYHAMDVFAFASKTETQGMVLTEAMAAGVPVVALDAPGAREVVVDGGNGRLLASENVAEFAKALRWAASRTGAEHQRLVAQARRTARAFSIAKTADTALDAYAAQATREFVPRQEQYGPWASLLGLIEAEWGLLKGVASAAGAAMSVPERRNDATR